MTIINTDVLAPGGPIEKTLFAGEDIPGEAPPATVLEERIDVYIAQAVAKNASVGFADLDAANLAWTLHLAFTAAHIIAVARPSREDAQVAVLGSEAFDKDQRDTLRTLASDFLMEYRVLLSAVPTIVQAMGVPSRSTTNEFDW